MDSLESEIENLLILIKVQRFYQKNKGKGKNMEKQTMDKHEQLAFKIMSEFGVKIPFLTWTSMTYEELLNLEKKLRNKK